MLFSINPEWVFWMGSAAALLLLVLVAIARPQASQTAQVMDSLGANRPAVDLRSVLGLFRQRKMWMFILYVVGVACVYDVFDQQFATFFKTFSPPGGGHPRLWFCHYRGRDLQCGDYVLLAVDH